MPSLEHYPVVRAGPCAVVRLPAEIDLSNAVLVSDTLQAVLNRGVSMLVADMTGTTFCACAGVSALARVQQRAAANRAELRVAASAPIVLRILALTGVDGLIPVHAGVADALAAAWAPPSAPEVPFRGVPC